MLHKLISTIIATLFHFFVKIILLKRGKYTLNMSNIASTFRTVVTFAIVVTQTCHI
jgi:hypothetical protein